MVPPQAPGAITDHLPLTTPGESPFWQPSHPCPCWLRSPCESGSTDRITYSFYRNSRIDLNAPAAQKPPVHRRPVGAGRPGRCRRRPPDDRGGHGTDHVGCGHRSDKRQPGHRRACGVPARELIAGWLINGTGPATDITCAADPLLRDLLGRGLARPDPLRLGINLSPAGAVLDTAGRPSSTIFTLGPPLRVWYESTAIPEIRDQAAVLARRLTAGCQARQRPGTAA